MHALLNSSFLLLLFLSGHDVWCDKNEIKAGDDWRCSITDGNASCQKFFAFLSKHSTREAAWSNGSVSPMPITLLVQPCISGGMADTLLHIRG